MAKIKVSDAEARDRIVRANITGNMERYGINDATAAKCLGIAERTFQAKKAQPGKFSMDEMRSLGRLLKFTAFQWASIGLGRELTTAEIRDFIL